MRIFKKHVRELSAGQENRAEKIAGGILKGQRKAADYLNRKTASISGTSWKLLLMGFCLAFGSYCLYLIVRVFI
jgi:hypothetical protein